MEMINIRVVYKNKIIGEESVKKGIILYDIKNKYNDIYKYPVVIAKINNENIELFKNINEDCEIEFLDLENRHANLAYKRSVALLMINSIRVIIGEKTRISIKYSINQNWSCEIKGVVIKDELLEKIEKYMRAMIERNEPIKKMNIPTNECIKLFNKYKMNDRANGLKYVRKSAINIYKIEETYDYLYGVMAVESGELDRFSLIKNDDKTFTINFVDKNDPNRLAEYKNTKKVTEVFEEANKWASIIGIDYVRDLNDAICNDKIKEKILISEALQEKKIANIADMITQNNKKVVLIAGPSSSGKTTFANRLCIQLKVNGIMPYVISLDNYYLDKKDIPKDENGKHDFECLEALDVKLIDENIKNLINGEVVEIPSFSFLKGTREKGKAIKLEENNVIILEGIHGLNEKISASIKHKDKFKIFISALTQLNIDSHNRIPTSDARIFRRIVRDHNFRGFGVDKTINMWIDVTKGEDKHIFPYQEDSDIIFNSALIYEIAVLKPFVEPLLYNIPNTAKEYAEASRLIKFLDSFLPITDLGVIPVNSIIREFIGGGCL